MLDALVGDAGVRGGDPRDFFHNLPAVFVVHGIPHTGGDFTDDLPVAFGFTRRIDRLANPLHPAFGIGKGSGFFRPAGRWQHHIRCAGGFRQEEILHHQKIQFLKTGLAVIQIRVGDQGIFTDDIKGLELSLVGGRNHLGDFQPGLVGQFVNPPGGGHFLAGRRIDHFLVSGVYVRQAAHVAGPLDVVLTPQGIDPPALDAQVAAKHGQIGQGLDVVRAGGVLGDAHAVQYVAARGTGIHPGGVDDILGGNAGNGLHVVGGIFFNDIPDFVKPYSAAFNILFGVQCFFDNDVHQTIDPGYVGAQIGSEPFVGITRNFDAPGIDDNQFCTLAGHRPFDIA